MNDTLERYRQASRYKSDFHMHTLPLGITFLERGWLSSNNVLIQDEHQAILVDTGYWTHANQTEQLVRGLLNNRVLDMIINTHLHSDHCGGNAHLQQSYSEVRTLIPAGQVAFVDSWNAEALTYTPTGQYCPPFSRTDILNNGDGFQINGAFWRVITAPGHDPHSIVLFNEQERILISADALWENGFGVVFPEIEGNNAFDEVQSTLQIIEQLKPSIVLPGHGSSFKDVSSALARARSRLKQFKNSPEKHAAYAAKVLLKFKLLELQKTTLHTFYSWALNCSYLKLLQKEYAPQITFKNWFELQCISLAKSSACKIEDNCIINV